MINIKIKKLNENARIPEYQTDGAAGMDLCASVSQPTVIAPSQRMLVPTGFAMSLPEGYAAFIYARSGLASKKGITLPNCVGVIDSDYRGEIKVALVNISDEPFEIKDGDRIAQMVISKVEKAKLEITDELDNTERAGGGFGSTGV